MQQDDKPSKLPTKRIRTEDDDIDDEPPRNQLTLTTQASTADKIVHINTAEYTAHPSDIIADRWIPKRTIDYIFKIMRHNDPQGTQFPIHLVPTTKTQWSVVDLNPLVMHKTYNSKPLLIWIIGTLIRYMHTSTIEDPIPRLQVIVEFLRTKDRDAAIALHNSSSSHPISTLHRLTVTSPTREDDGPATYDQIYDATRRLQSKANMLEIPLSRIEGGDIVLVECTLVRTEEVTHRKNILFALNALCLLAEKPRLPRNKVTHPQNELCITIDA